MEDTDKNCLEVLESGSQCIWPVYKNQMCYYHYYRYLKNNKIPAKRTIYPWKGNKDHWRDVYLIL